MKPGTRDFQALSLVGDLRQVRGNEYVIYGDVYGREILGYLRPRDVISVVGYDYNHGELQVLTRLGVGWVGTFSMQYTNKLTAEGDET